ncbi:MAG: T9SS type A sorting domain-containing protein [Sphingobacteriaceae bacterium]|nr:MAG: T9SS type A sorting domain-containing protein [Sphingobacteriaceae bacterium]
MPTTWLSQQIAVGTAELNGFAISGGRADGSSSIIINTNTINQNYGSGMYNSSSSPLLTNLTISGNVGGMYNNSSSPTLINVTISGNTATNGGGMHNSSSSPVLINVSISGNVASANGGGMINSLSSPVLTNVTISGNSASVGGGMYNNLSSSPKINNSIIYNNNTGVTNSVSTPVYKNSLVQGNPTGAAMVNYTGAANIIFVNPQAPGLSTLGDYSLLAGSAAINAGSNQLYTAAGGDLATGKDLVGNPRVVEMTIDMGAYENQTIIVLPVNFGKFTATAESNRIKLDWNTFSETNNEAFIIYRSSDGLNYTEIITQNSKGSNANSYTALDNSPANGVNYYRLNQKDNDGSIYKLADAVVNFSLANAEVKAWPNPVEKALHINFAAGKYQSLKLVDITGRTLQKLNISITQSEIEIDMATYTKGIYMVELKGKDGSHLMKVIK